MSSSSATLTAIAARFGVSLAALEAANPQISDPNQIFPGQVVSIPGSSPSLPDQAVSSSSSATLSPRSLPVSA